MAPTFLNFTLMLKKSILLLGLLLPLGIFSSCGDEEKEAVNNEESTEVIQQENPDSAVLCLPTPAIQNGEQLSQVSTREQLSEVISSEIVDYVVEGTTKAFDEMTSYWNYPYIAYTYMYSWFSDRDLLTEQLNEKLIEQVNMEGIDAIIRKEVACYNAGNQEKISLKKGFAEGHGNAWEKELQQLIQQNETVANVKEEFLIDLQDNGVNLLVVLAILIPLSMIMKRITKKIAGCYDIYDSNHQVFGKLREKTGFWGKVGLAGAEVLLNRSVMRDIERLERKKRNINITYFVIDIAVLVGSIYYFGGKSEANFAQFAERMIQSMVEVISNYDLSGLFM